MDLSGVSCKGQTCLVANGSSNSPVPPIAEVSREKTLVAVQSPMLRLTCFVPVWAVALQRCLGLDLAYSVLRPVEMKLVLGQLDLAN